MLPLENPPDPDELEREILSWTDVDKLIDHLIPQLQGEFEGLLMITKGGLIPGRILSEALKIQHVLTAAVQFPDEINQKLAWPTFMQFPSDTLLTGRRILIVDDIWANGRANMIVRGRLAAVGCNCETAVLHFRERDNLFRDSGPEYYGAITSRYIIYPWERSVLPHHSSNPPGPGFPTI